MNVLVEMQGKSLSVICGSLRWLGDSERRDREAVERALAGDTTATSCGATGADKKDGDDGMHHYHSLILFCAVNYQSVGRRSM